MSERGAGNTATEITSAQETGALVCGWLATARATVLVQYHGNDAFSPSGTHFSNVRVYA